MMTNMTALFVLLLLLPLIGTIVLVVHVLSRSHHRCYAANNNHDTTPLVFNVNNDFVLGGGGIVVPQSNVRGDHDDIIFSNAKGDSTDDGDHHTIQVFQSQQEAIDAVRRDDICTIVLMGAFWDGHFNAFLTRNKRSTASTSTEQKSKEEARLDLSFFSSSARNLLCLGKQKLRTLSSLFLLLLGRNKDGRRYHENIGHASKGGGRSASNNNHCCSTTTKTINQNRKLLDAAFWQSLAQELRKNTKSDHHSFELAFLEYDGSETGPMSIPSELLSTPTLGSYGWFAYRGGKLMHSESSNRLCYEQHPPPLEHHTSYAYYQKLVVRQQRDDTTTATTTKSPPPPCYDSTSTHYQTIEDTTACFEKVCALPEDRESGAIGMPDKQQ